MDLKRDYDLVVTEAQVESAYARLAEMITKELADSNPVVICLLLGGLIPFGRIMSKTSFQCDFDYIHATRYRGATTGSDMHWLSGPQADIEGRNVLVIDDILDEGITLSGVEKGLLEKHKAKKVYKAVLVKKVRKNKAMTEAHFVGLEVPDRYVFGCGMDYKGRYRNISEIYALRG